MSTTALANAEAVVETAARETQFVLLTIGAETYGVEIGLVHGIIMPQTITEVPKTPGYVRGVTNLRGNILPVIDMRSRFGLPRQIETEAKNTRFVVVEASSMTAALIVDAVTEVAWIASTNIEPPSQLVNSEATECIAGVGKLSINKSERLIMILDIVKLLERDLAAERGTKR